MNLALSPHRLDASTGIRAHRQVRYALALSTAIHLAAVAVLIWSGFARADRPSRDVAREATPERIEWVVMVGPSGGGGGRLAPTPTRLRPEPPPQAVRTRDLPAPTPVTPSEVAPPLEAPLLEAMEPQPPVLVNLADTPMAGAANAPLVPAGGGDGSGSGRGVGEGAGPGMDRGFGEGAYRPGNGVTPPVPVRRGLPRYTAEAMRARAHGTITIECVVEPDGACGDVRIVRAFAPPYGLDREAVDAARRSLFRPGTRGGEPVPVLVSLEIEFNIH